MTEPPATQAPVSAPVSPTAARFIAFLEHPRLGLWLALIGALLVSPSLAIGFHLDDYVHRYLLSDLPDADRLRRAYESPFGIANGERADNHWQVEQGYAPYWIDPDLLVSLYRPVSELSHALDAALFPSSAVLQHAHSIGWFALLLAAVTGLYRALHGRNTIAGLAALLYAFDHTHGFAVGWIANRNAPLASCLGVLALLLHHKARQKRSLPLSLLAGSALLCALLSGEGAVAIAGFLLVYTMTVDRGSSAALAHKLAYLAPHGAALLVWRALYAVADRGARGSGLYLDPAREPLAFAMAALERMPVLLFGELLLPPAEAYVFTSPPLPAIMWCVSVLVAGLLAVAAAPLIQRDRLAAFWAFSTVLALVPAVSTHPNNRLLFFVGLGCMGLLSQLWHGVLEHAPWLPADRMGLTRVLTATIVGFHLVVSPFVLPVTACSVAFTAAAREAADAILAAAADGPSAPNDVIVLSAPDYYYTKLARPIAALEGRVAPRRLRALSFGAVRVTVTRHDARTLLIGYADGLLREPLLTLYRAPNNPVRQGERIELEGLSIEVTALTADGHIAAVRCAFEQDLGASSLRFLAWDGARLAPVRIPEVGASFDLPPAQVRFGL